MKSPEHLTTPLLLELIERRHTDLEHRSYTGEHKAAKHILLRFIYEMLIKEATVKDLTDPASEDWVQLCTLALSISRDTKKSYEDKNDGTLRYLLETTRFYSYNSDWRPMRICHANLQATNMLSDTNIQQRIQLAYDLLTLLQENDFKQDPDSPIENEISLVKAFVQGRGELTTLAFISRLLSIHYRKEKPSPTSGLVALYTREASRLEPNERSKFRMLNALYEVGACCRQFRAGLLENWTDPEKLLANKFVGISSVIYHALRNPSQIDLAEFMIRIMLNLGEIYEAHIEDSQQLSHIAAKLSRVETLRPQMINARARTIHSSTLLTFITDNCTVLLNTLIKGQLTSACITIFEDPRFLKLVVKMQIAVPANLLAQACALKRSMSDSEILAEPLIVVPIDPQMKEAERKDADASTIAYGMKSLHADLFTVKNSQEFHHLFTSVLYDLLRSAGALNSGLISADTCTRAATAQLASGLIDKIPVVGKYAKVGADVLAMEFQRRHLNEVRMLADVITHPDHLHDVCEYFATHLTGLYQSSIATMSHADIVRFVNVLIDGIKKIVTDRLVSTEQKFGYTLLDFLHDTLDYLITGQVIGTNNTVLSCHTEIRMLLSIHRNNQYYADHIAQNPIPVCTEAQEQLRQNRALKQEIARLDTLTQKQAEEMEGLRETTVAQSEEIERLKKQQAQTDARILTAVEEAKTELLSAMQKLLRAQQPLGIASASLATTASVPDKDEEDSPDSRASEDSANPSGSYNLLGSFWGGK